MRTSGRLSVFLSLASLATPLLAQNDFDLDKLTSGTHGANVQLLVRNAPANAAAIVMLSLTAGPTPISIVDPLDSRSVEVGLDLFNEWFFAITSPTGTATVGLFIPISVVFQGLNVHWQTFTFPGSPTLIDEISNDVVTQLGATGLASVAPSNLLVGRAFATASINPNFNIGAGDVVVAGGGTGTLTGATGLASSEIFDFRELSVRAGPSLASARALHMAVQLQDGRTLLSGGVDATGNAIASCEVYDPVTNTFSATASMSSARALHAATRLADGRVMVAGGTSSLLDPVSALIGTLATAEIWNPATGTWSAAANIGGNRMAPALSLLPNGRILVSGGIQVTFLFGFPTAAGTTTAAQIYNPATNSWAAAAPMATARTGHQLNQVTLQSGRVLMTGGIGVTVNIATQTLTATPLSSAEYYDQPANTWTTVTMPTARSLHTATLLPDGRVLVCGGAQGTLDVPVPIANVESFNPATNLWTPQSPLTSPRAGHVAARLPDGLLVLLGGQDSGGTTASIETLHY